MDPKVAIESIGIDIIEPEGNFTLQESTYFCII